jgi:hypothetical protein
MTTELQVSDTPVIERSLSAEQVELFVLKKNLTQYKFPPKRWTTDLTSVSKTPQNPQVPPLLSKSKSASFLEGIKQLLVKKGSKEAL